MPIKVLINTYPTAFIVPGGGEIQLKNTVEHLKNLSGINVSLYDMWNPNIENADIVHFFSVYGGSSSFCESVKKKGKKLVVSPVIWLDDFSKYPIDEIRKILSAADLILPNSNAEINMLYTKLGIPKEKMMPVYNAVNININKNEEENLFKKTYNIKKFILNVGNIEYRKNQLNLIKAVQYLDMPLVLIGDIRDDEYWRRCREEDINNKVVYIGKLEHDSDLLIAAYREAECFVLPSILETPGLAALEAAAAGCGRIAVTSIGSAREYFGDKVGYIDEPEDYTHILDVVKNVMVSKRLNKDYADCIINKFNWDKTACDTAKAYKKVMSMQHIDMPDICNFKDILLKEGFYETEFDGKNYFRWIKERALGETINKIDCFKLEIEAEENQRLIIDFGGNRQIFALKSGINNISAKNCNNSKVFELKASLKPDLPAGETRKLTVKILKIEVE